MMDSVNERWTRCKELLRQRLGEEDAATWLPSLELASLEAGRAVLRGIPNSYFRNRIQLRFAPLLRQCLAEAFGPPAQGEALQLDLQVGMDGAGTGSLPTDGAGRAGMAAPAAATPGYGEPEAPGEEAADNGAATHAGYAFADCILGEANRSALALAKEVAREPGGRFNPFFVVGGVGLGKTHLLRTIAGEVARAWPRRRVVYRTAEQFANDVLDGIRRKRMPAVREIYRSADLLLLDDVQFLQVSERSQQELLHTFDALHARGRQLVFSSDRFPAELTRLEPTLHSRLEMGLVAELGTPDREMRLALLEAKARAHGLALPAESAALLADRIGSGFRQVEGALVRVAAYAALGDEQATPAFVAEVAEPFFDEEPLPPGIPVTGEAVLGQVCDHFGLTMKELRSRGRTAHLAKARRVAVYLLREAGGLSFPEIGAALGNRTHSTVLHAMGRMREELRDNPLLRRAVLQMRRAMEAEMERARRAG